MRVVSSLDRVYLTLTVVERVHEGGSMLGSPRMIVGLVLLLLGLLGILAAPALAAVLGGSGLLMVLTASGTRSATHDVERDLTFRIDRGGVWYDDLPCRVRVDRSSIGFDGHLYPLARPLTGEELLEATRLLDRDTSGAIPEALRSAVIDR